LLLLFIILSDHLFTIRRQRSRHARLGSNYDLCMTIGPARTPLGVQRQKKDAESGRNSVTEDVSGMGTPPALLETFDQSKTQATKTTRNTRDGVPDELAAGRAVTSVGTGVCLIECDSAWLPVARLLPRLAFSPVSRYRSTRLTLINLASRECRFQRGPILPWPAFKSLSSLQCTPTLFKPWVSISQSSWPASACSQRNFIQSTHRLCASDPPACL
jgi:hypothetical protein